jgi:hypothetical protein
MRTLLGVAVLFSSVALQAAENPYASVLIRGVPHVRQKPDFCGEACAEMILRELGKPLSQDAVFDRSGLDPAEGRGCHTADLARALTSIGFRIGPVWQRVAVASAKRQMEDCFAALHADLARGIASIVCMRFDERPDTTEHFRLVLGYDATTDDVIYHDPAIDNGAYLRMKKERFMSLWPLKYSTSQWTIVRLRLEPEKLSDLASAADRPASAGFTPAAYAQHILQLKKRFAADDGFTVVIARPFVVIGDESVKTVERRATDTVAWAVDRLKRFYFDRDPAQILDVWLFKDKESYERHVEKLFGEKPTTPYGYFSAAHRALIMNISTGGGTLVHEIVHPFMAANFPLCPSWFNEGLASLYEQSGEDSAGIHGYPNWRLPSLQKAIRAERVPTFEALTATTTNEFYRSDPGTNYAQARYLCYYLQEQGLLRKYYRRFKANADKDPTGYKTLEEILGTTDMPAFQKKWEAYVLKIER